MKRRQNNFIKRDSAEERSILKMLCPSILGIMVCVICLAGMSWAWFTAGVQSQSTMTAASYTLGETVRVKQEGSSPASSTDALKKSADGTYTLEANKQYAVTLKPTATPKNGGYCIVKITYSDGNDGTTEVRYCTAALTKDTEFSFTISNGDKDAKCQFMAAWGTPDAGKFTGGNAVKSGDEITLNGGAQTQKSADEKAAGTDAAEPSSSDNAGNSGSDSSDQNGQSTTNSKNSQPSTDKNTDSTGSRNTDNAGSSQAGTE